MSGHDQKVGYDDPTGEAVKQNSGDVVKKFIVESYGGFGAARGAWNDPLQPSFETEQLARDFLEQLLGKWFILKSEVWLSHPDGNRLRIDYLAKPRDDTDFPFEFFGIECKRDNEHGGLNRAIKQAVDYTRCLITDDRPSLERVRNKPLGLVYIFPAPALTDTSWAATDGWHYGAVRFAGLFRVGVIHLRHNGKPQFRMSAERHWDPDFGARKTPIHTRDLVGSGVERRAAE